MYYSKNRFPVLSNATVLLGKKLPLRKPESSFYSYWHVVLHLNDSGAAILDFTDN